MKHRGPNKGRSRLTVICACLFAAHSMASGCKPVDYRLRADAETYEVLVEKGDDIFWIPPSLTITPPPDSRNFDPFDPDAPPIPPDDPAAQQYMHCVDGMRGYAGWHEQGEAPFIESEQWRAFLQVDEDGTLEINTQQALELAISNSRQYQFELEELYLTALSLTLERFEFDTQWFGLTSLFFDHFGTSSTPGDESSDTFQGNESNELSVESEVGFTRQFASGGQLLVDFANTFLWEFTGPNTGITFSSLSFRLVQPLLRGFGREVRLESLTQAERNVLYALRAFARFRKVFYFDIVTGSDGYLGLLLQLQSVRNLRANVDSLEQNLLVHKALAVAGIVSPLQVDQVFQDYQAGKLRLIQAENRLATSLDALKLRMGLPPELEIELDDTALQPFELTASGLTELQLQVDNLLETFRELDEAPTRARLREGFRELASLFERAALAHEAITQELTQWEVEVDEKTVLDAQQIERERDTRDEVERRLPDLYLDIEGGTDDARQAIDSLERESIEDAWATIQSLARLASSQVADLSVLQTQIRANLIALDQVEFQEGEAVAYALQNRLDLSNRRAQVVDAWRKIHVAADALEADLDVIVEGNLLTPPDGNNPLDFSARDSSYRAGLRLDGPLNRKLERNLYRSQLISYQRSRRAFIALRDQVVQAVRRDMRELAADRLNFEITRQQLITAARQVELARVQLLAPGQASDSSATQDVLRALDSLLASKNALIGIWVAYETDRLRLLLNTGAMQLDERGILRPDRVSLTPPATPASESEVPPVPTVEVIPRSKQVEMADE